MKDIKTRLANYLLEQSSTEHGNTVCRLIYSKKELASLLGTIPEILSRAFTFLKQKGLIAEKDNLVIIPEPQKLKNFSI